MERVGIICNKQMIPYDAEKPWISSGVRLGSPALTTRGLVKKEFLEIAKVIDLILRNCSDKKIIKIMKSRVGYLSQKSL
jgi:glycine hydroxymethyltransferase